MNEKILTVLLAVIAILAVCFLPGAPLAAAEILTLKLMYIALLLGVLFATVYALRGTNYDVLAEIFDTDNKAAAIFVGAIVIALALVIGK